MSSPRKAGTCHTPAWFHFDFSRSVFSSASRKDCQCIRAPSCQAQAALPVQQLDAVSGCLPISWVDACEHDVAPLGSSLGCCPLQRHGRLASGGVHLFGTVLFCMPAHVCVPRSCRLRVQCQWLAEPVELAGCRAVSPTTSQPLPVFLVQSNTAEASFYQRQPSSVKLVKSQRHVVSAVLNFGCQPDERSLMSLSLTSVLNTWSAGIAHLRVKRGAQSVSRADGRHRFLCQADASFSPLHGLCCSGTAVQAGISSMPSLKPTRAPACKLRFRFCDVASPGYFPLRLAGPVSADVNIVAAAIQRPASHGRCWTSRRVAKSVAMRTLLPPGQILRHSNCSELLQMSEASFDGPLLAMPTISLLGHTCVRRIEFASLMPTDLVQSAGNVFISEFAACTQLPGTTLGQLNRSLMSDGCNLRLRTLERRDHTIYQRLASLLCITSSPC
ncbi:unnamed protein product [Polarella glacialis]|uniref:Uncharacterized protein n=1 Tax=Polarella glacialis TaxID=89957 RepID=A0A813GLW7_POLGL|nr:unnamed protein product [Polarella glacialis]